MKPIGRSIGLFLFGTAVAFVFCCVTGSVTSLIFAAFPPWLSSVFVFVLYLSVLNFFFYGTEKKRRYYTDALPRERQITQKEDAVTFALTEFVPVFLSYAALTALVVFAFGGDKGSSPWLWYLFCTMLTAAGGYIENRMIKYIVCLLFFAAGFAAISLRKRAKLREMHYDLMFGNTGQASK